MAKSFFYILVILSIVGLVIFISAWWTEESEEESEEEQGMLWGLALLGLCIFGIVDFTRGCGGETREAKEEAAEESEEEPLTEDELRDGGLKMFMDNRLFFRRYVTMTKYGNEYDQMQGYDLFEEWNVQQREAGNWNANSMGLFLEAEKHAIRDLNSR